MVRTFCQRAEQQDAGQGGARVVAQQRDPPGVAAEGRRVVLDPAQQRHDVPRAEVQILAAEPRPQKACREGKKKTKKKNITLGSVHSFITHIPKIL